MKDSFSKWIRWRDRANVPGLTYPGVYALAICTTDINGTPFDWRQEIAYVGMTNSRGGLKSRLRQFDRTIDGGDEHGGAHRVRFRHPDYAVLTKKLYVAVRYFQCDVKSNAPHDLRVMGEVAKEEFECFAKYVERFGRLPEFNDKKRSPKK